MFILRRGTCNTMTAAEHGLYAQCNTVQQYLGQNGGAQGSDRGPARGQMAMNQNGNRGYY